MNYSPQYFVIYNQERLYEITTSNTRSKIVMLGSTNDIYYFKTSLNKFVDGKVGKEFPYGFWAGMIA